MEFELFIDLLSGHAFIVEFGFKLCNFFFVGFSNSFVPSYIAQMKYYTGNKHYQQDKRAELKHPDFLLKTKQQIEVFAVAIHVNTKNENE